MICLQDTRGCSILKFINNLFTLLLPLLFELYFRSQNHPSLLQIVSVLTGLNLRLEHVQDLWYDKHLLILSSYLLKQLGRFERNAPQFLEFYLPIHLLIYQNVFLQGLNYLFLGPKFQYDRHQQPMRNMKKCLETNIYH